MRIYCRDISPHENFGLAARLYAAAARPATVRASRYMFPGYFYVRASAVSRLHAHGHKNRRSMLFALYFSPRWHSFQYRLIIVIGFTFCHYRIFTAAANSRLSCRRRSRRLFRACIYYSFDDFWFGFVFTGFSRLLFLCFSASRSARASMLSRCRPADMTFSPHIDSDKEAPRHSHSQSISLYFVFIYT